MPTSSHASPKSESSSCIAIAQDQLLFDDVRVFQRLKIECVDVAFLDECLASFFEDNASAISQLKALEAEAEQVDGSSQEEDHREKVDRIERDMRPPLVRSTLFWTQDKKFKGVVLCPEIPRGFQGTKSGSMIDGSGTIDGLTQVDPSFVLKTSLSYVAFVVVKSTKQQGPKNQNLDDHSVRPIVLQTARHARVQTTMQRFSLISVSLLIFGSNFCVCIFDRVGATFSPVCNMWDNAETFIRIIRSITCLLRPVDLGVDPSVWTVPRSVALQPQVPERERHHTSYVFTFQVEKQVHHWCTIGLPLQLSRSLFGRCTTVWRVRRLVAGSMSGPVMVIKNYWRSSHRDPKARRSSYRPHPEMTSFVMGADMYQPRAGSDAQRITVRNLRGDPVDDLAETLILYREVTRDASRPLWEYSSDYELLSGLCTALNEHKLLYDRGILHRNIDAGSVRLVQNHPARVGVGLLIDLEFTCKEPEASVTSIKDGEVTKGTTPHSIFTGGTEPSNINNYPRLSAALPWSPEFMAIDLLQRVELCLSVNHTVEHDAESFIWVLGFSVMKKLRMIAMGEEVALLDKHFRKAFRHRSILDNFAHIVEIQQGLRARPKDFLKGIHSPLGPDDRFTHDVLRNGLAACLLYLHQEKFSPSCSVFEILKSMANVSITPT
ncbi:hypothetical protein EW146_g2771 [Bondarzewia mesenterica]|uniref:Fungal-type protein kinase domain-containing protein n=1 Tax=Bondarzewia mesenterica TaxID=1095465 RepID=A0A4S4LZM4_9AGAM|nr:hypothetical protein EW146_g2771 [Bondarzewia mesenterica]